MLSARIAKEMKANEGIGAKGDEEELELSASYFSDSVDLLYQLLKERSNESLIEGGLVSTQFVNSSLVLCSKLRVKKGLHKDKE